MSAISNYFKRIAATSSRDEKNAILNEAMSSELGEIVKIILEDTYSTRKYYVKKYEVLSTSGAYKSIDRDYIDFAIVLEKLATRQVTGNAAIEMVGTIIGQFEEDDRWILEGILNKNIKMGLGKTTTADYGLIKKFPVALANSYHKAKNNNVFGGTWYASQKLDGCRCLAFVDCTNPIPVVKFMSRQGKEIKTLQVLAQDIYTIFRGQTGKYVVDGEVCIIDENGKESFQGLMSEISRKDHIIINPYYKIFDLLTEDEFWGNIKSIYFGDRYSRLKEIMTDTYEHAGLVEQVHIHDEQQLNELIQKARDNGWEGLMLRNNVPYEGKRTNNLLKIKEFSDAEYVVKGVVTGPYVYNSTNGSQKFDTVLALIISHKGNEVQVGSGLSIKQRMEWYEDHSQIVGKTITVQYFEETKDKKTGLPSLRFPTLKYVYENGRTL